MFHWSSSLAISESPCVEKEQKRVAAIVALALALSVVASLFMSTAWFLVGALVVLGAWLNRDLYRLLLRKGGLWFAINGFLLQQLYYLCSIFGLATLKPDRRVNAA